MSEKVKAEEQIREEKLAELRKLGIDPYPSKSTRTVTIGEALAKFSSLKSKKSINLVGRITGRRRHGGLMFADLKDASGTIQLIFKRDDIGEKQFDLFNDLFDNADFIEATGKLALSKTGEQSLVIASFTMLTKAMRPLPEKWHGLQDIETRYRKRYLDLLVNDEVKDRFIVRNTVIQTIRNLLLKKDYLEVDTPVLQPLAGGALATPFKTHYEAENCDVFLRIAPELYLKRLIIGGFERVFEFARVFRNEGVSAQHLQDFTMLEFYQAYADYQDLMKLTEEIMTAVVKAINKDKLTMEISGHKVNFKAPYVKKTMRELILDATKIDIAKYDDADDLMKAIKAKKVKLSFTGKAGLGKLIDELYKETVRPNLIQPTFVTDHPVALSPLAKRQPKNPDTVQRFQLIVGGWELVNAFSELNDPVDQNERFKEQVKAKKAGDSEAHSADDAFVEALEHGLPPTAGFGMGIERLVAVLTNADNIREVVLFPFVKDK